MVERVDPGVEPPGRVARRLHVELVPTALVAEVDDERTDVTADVEHGDPAPAATSWWPWSWWPWLWSCPASCRRHRVAVVGECRCRGTSTGSRAGRGRTTRPRSRRRRRRACRSGSTSGMVTPAIARSSIVVTSSTSLRPFGNPAASPAMSPSGFGSAVGGMATLSRSMSPGLGPVKFWKPGTTPAGMPVSRMAWRSARSSS